MRARRVGNVAPRNGETHGLFGYRFLKHHKMRDQNWAANDLIEQYDRICEIYEKANKNKNLKKEHSQFQKAILYKDLRKELKDKQEALQTILKGDVQRTKNVLQNFPEYMRIYQYKQSFEVLEELDFKSYHLRKTLDRYTGERNNLIKKYEDCLLEVAKKQENNRYYDVKEFQQERDTKRLYVELKNSETRNRAVEKINFTYKMIIDQMVHDSLYYIPVLEALNSDYTEQTALVQQTYNIGYPAIKHVREIEMEVKDLLAVMRNEENMCFEEINKSRHILRQHPKLVKELVRRDSDFPKLGDRYARETSSMTNLKEEVEDCEKEIRELKLAILCNTPEQIVPRINFLYQSSDKWTHDRVKKERVFYNKMDVFSIYEFVHDTLMEDFTDVYKEKDVKETEVLKKLFNAEIEKQKALEERRAEHDNFLMHMTEALQHMIDVLRHVGSLDFYEDIKIPEGRLRLPLLKFNRNLPKEPRPLIMNTVKLLQLTKTKVSEVMKYYNNVKDDKNVQRSVADFQKAYVQDYLDNYRPRVESFEFD